MYYIQVSASSFDFIQLSAMAMFWVIETSTNHAIKSSIINPKKINDIDQRVLEMYYKAYT